MDRPPRSLTLAMECANQRGHPMGARAVKLKRSTIIALSLSMISMSMLAYGDWVGCCPHHPLSFAFARPHHAHCTDVQASSREVGPIGPEGCSRCTCLTSKHAAFVTYGSSPGTKFIDRAGRNTAVEAVVVPARFTGTARLSISSSLLTLDGKDRVLRECSFLS